MKILRVDSNETPVRIVAYGSSGIYLELANVTEIQNLTLELYHFAPGEIGFIRESRDATVSVLALLYCKEGATVLAQLCCASVCPYYVLASQVIPFGLGVVILGTSLYWFYAIERNAKTKLESKWPSHARPAFIAVLMLFSSLCFTPVTVLYGINEGHIVYDAQWYGYFDLINVELNASQPQYQTSLRSWGDNEISVSMTADGGSVAMGFQTESGNEEFIAKFASGEGVFLHIQLQKDAILTLTKVDSNITLWLYWMSGGMIHTTGPNWGFLLFPPLTATIVSGIASAAYGIVLAKRLSLSLV